MGLVDSEQLDYKSTARAVLKKEELKSAIMIFNFEISSFSLFLCPGFWIPMAVRSSEEIVCMLL